MTAVLTVSNHLTTNAEELALEIVNDVLNNMELEIPDLEKEQAIKMYVSFINFLAESLFTGSEDVPETLIEWSKNNARIQVTEGGEISEILLRYPPTREVFTDLVTNISKEFGLSLDELGFIIKQINKILDITMNETVFAFERLSEEYKEATKRELAELSAPIVLVKERVAVLPLIGLIDDYRSQYIMEHVVSKIAEQQIDIVIADFSGVLTIDTEIARHLHQIGQMLDLLGIKTLTTGLRPELAIVAVQSGISMSDITSFTNVKQALESIK